MSIPKDMYFDINLNLGLYQSPCTKVQVLWHRHDRLVAWGWRALVPCLPLLARATTTSKAYKPSMEDHNQYPWHKKMHYWREVSTLVRLTLWQLAAASLYLDTGFYTIYLLKFLRPLFPSLLHYLVLDTECLLLVFGTSWSAGVFWRS